MSARRASGGFTLLEVMVALAILAGALVALSEVTGAALRNHVRARNLEVATMLARAKMVEVQAQAERKGFRDFDETDDGSFEAEGHPEITWKLEIRRPTVEVGAEGALAALTGGKKLDELLPPPEQAPQLALFRNSLTGIVQGLLVRIGEQLKKSVREVRLTVSWPEGRTSESFDVVTHLVVGEPEEK